MSDFDNAAGDRLAKVIARSGLCSRRDAEGWIKDGRVTVNGRKVLTPAFNVTEKDKIKVDGEPLAARQGTRVWLYHKPAGLVVTEKDPEGRPTVFEALQDKELPRVVSIGRLDINTEGLLLVTNDGGLKRVLELPATGWLRRYRVRAFGAVTQAQLDTLKDGIEIEGVQYGPIEAVLEREQGSNSWLVLGLREGKNREVKNVLGALGLQVNRLIRVSYGPFQLGDLGVGEVEAVPARVLREQLGRRLAAEANTDFESEMPEMAAQRRKSAANPRLRAAAPGETPKPQSARKSRLAGPHFRFTDPESERAEEAARAERPRQDRPGRSGPARPPRPTAAQEDRSETRRVLFDDGREETMKVKPQRAAAGPRRWDADESSARDFGRPRHHDDQPARPPRGDRPDRTGETRRPAAGKRPWGDKPPFGDKKPFAARGPRPEGDRSARPGRPAGAGRGPARDDADRGARSSGPRKAFAPREDGGRSGPPRGSGKPFAPRAEGARPAGKPSFGDRRPDGPGQGAKKPGGGFGKPYGDRSAGDRKPGGKPTGNRFDDRPRGPGGRSGPGGKPAGGRPGNNRPGGSRPGGDRPGGNRPTGGDRPRAPRKPRD